ncbi:(+)-neomenthol dehydrogenase [Sesamum angolense]|uniref:Short-chain dehydrogenase/reductase n=1 Tax=Sesamum angolense TaxID=2727404 RepID=A0AAE1XG96_9LAMI|nr:(+)-neomenthol dehydrogenase [Sesamum angolense]
MAEASSKAIKATYAVVSGANKGIGFEICRQLASHGITVVLTARYEKKGLQAINQLKGTALSDHVIFHQLDVTDLESIALLAKFIKSQFGKLDILIREANVNWDELVTQTYEAAVEGLQTNYYGAKRLSEALLPLLRLSDSPRIVNVSSASGKLKYITNEWAKEVLIDAENLGEESLDQVLNEFLKNFQDGNLYVEGQPGVLAAYTISKAAMNAYTRILAKKYPGFRINSVCPGYVKTDINCNTGILAVEEGAESVVRLALLPVDGPSGLFFVRNEVSSLEE